MAKNKYRDRDDESVEFAEEVQAVPEKSEKVLKSKADVIRESKLPDSEKERYLREIGELKDEPFDPSKISLEVYATIKSVPVERVKSMKVYPKASGVKLATLAEWNEIFKNF